MSEHVIRRLRSFLVFGTALLAAGVILGCLAMLHVASWTLQFGGKPEGYPLTNAESEAWLAYFHFVDQVWWCNAPFECCGLTTLSPGP